MKKVLVYLMMMLPLAANADLLSDLLGDVYKAKTMSDDQMDSVLNGSNVEKKATVTGQYTMHYENKKQLFRHSFEANYYLIDQKGKRYDICDQPIRDAQMSPDGKYIVYAKQNNLYVYKVDFKTNLAITDDKNPEHLYGISDWLYEEEFGITCMFAFSPDSKKVAFVRLDETEVPTFSWQKMLDETGEALRYPNLFSLRYPKAGDHNAQASVLVYDFADKTTRTMQLGEMDNWYIPRITWRETYKGKETNQELLIQKMNRDQNHMEILAGNPKTTVTHPFYKEQCDKYYVDYSLFDQWVWLSDGSFVVLSEKSGWMQAYLYASDGRELKQLTKDGMDLTCIYGMDEQKNMVYYQAAPNPMERQAYAVDMKKCNIKMLTKEAGTHDLTFSDDMKQYIDCYQSLEVPNRYTLYTQDGKKVKELLNNDDLQQRWEAAQLPKTEFTKIPTERGDTLNAYTIMPNNMEAGKKYPVILIQYSGPGSQRVLNKWRKRWGTYLANEGYIVVDADGRGTACRGRAWCNATYMNLGKKEAEDQISVAKYMAGLDYVDGERIAMVGWSYGGFQTIRTMCEPGSPIKCGMAIAPVIDWRLYDSAYTERYMRRPQVNEFGYDHADLTRMADQLQGRLLLVHGLADDNVHAQNALLFIDALVKAGKQFDMQLYPDDNHFLRKRSNYDHLHRRLMEFLEKNL
ncbi:MAG: S9 family peptidase [Paludibacteraceae bacterium]|nr:S9 family peptidase [Paludibacteraceae bacterium]